MLKSYAGFEQITQSSVIYDWYIIMTMQKRHAKHAFNIHSAFDVQIQL